MLATPGLTSSVGQLQNKAQTSARGGPMSVEDEIKPGAVRYPGFSLILAISRAPEHIVTF